jgi:uncharacterized membrane protein
MIRSLKLPFLTFVLLALLQAVWHHAHLPARVATHFDAHGHANGWMSRNTHFLFQAGLAIFLGVLFGSIPRLIRRLPDSLINIPHREYWLARERRAATLAWIGNAGYVLGCVVLAFFMLVFQQVFVANTSGPLELKLMPLVIGQFVFVVVLIVLLMSRFQRPPAPPARRPKARR